jgi:lactoylglutathione lyase
MDVIHSAIWVSDIERTLEFYTDELGLEERYEFTTGEQTRNVFVSGESDTEIQFRYDPDREPEPPAGFDHLALAVDDVEVVVEQVADLPDASVTREPFDVDIIDSRVAFVQDPDGYSIELIEALA